MIPPKTSCNNLVISHDALHLLHGRLPCTVQVPWLCRGNDSVGLCLHPALNVLTRQFSPYDFHTGDLTCCSITGNHDNLASVVLGLYVASLRSELDE